MIQEILAPVIVLMAVGYTLFQLYNTLRLKSNENDATCSGCYGSCHTTRELLKARKPS